MLRPGNVCERIVPAGATLQVVIRRRHLGQPSPKPRRRAVEPHQATDLQFDFSRHRPEQTRGGPARQLSDRAVLSRRQRYRSSVGAGGTTLLPACGTSKLAQYAGSHCRRARASRPAQEASAPLHATGEPRPNSICAAVVRRGINKYTVGGSYVVDLLHPTRKQTVWQDAVTSGSGNAPRVWTR